MMIRMIIDLLIFMFSQYFLCVHPHILSAQSLLDIFKLLLLIFRHRKIRKLI